MLYRWEENMEEVFGVKQEMDIVEQVTRDIEMT